jgi:predicted Zn finger-like uncharacterized protein
VTIGTECPHCESVFQVDAALRGKAMRCPNPTCKQVFTVAAVAPPHATTRAAPVLDAEPVDEILDAEPLAAPVPAKPRPARAAPPVPRAAAVPATPAPRAPKVVDYADEKPAGKGTDRKPPAGKPKRKNDDSDIPLRRTKPKGKGLGVLIGLLALVLVLVGATAGLFLLQGQQSEEKDAAEAEKMYKDGRYGDAKRKFDTLATDYPNSSGLPRYQFFSALAQTQADATNPSIKEDPSPAQRSLTAFISAHGESTLAQPGSEQATDVVLVGIKVSAAYADNAADKVKKFQGDRTKLDLLAAAEKVVAEGRAVIPPVEKYRGKEGPGFDDARKRFDEVDASIKKERERLATLLPWRDLATDPTDSRIDSFEKAMKAAALDNDEEVKRMAAEAKVSLRKLVVWVPEVVAAMAPPIEAGAVVAAAVRVSNTPDVRIPVGKPDAVFGIARGVLYAVDSRTGKKLWAERVSAEARTSDAPLRVTFPDGTTDWVIVPSVRGGQAAVTARDTFTGEAVWHQELPAPVLGKPVRVGGRLIVPLADQLGTLMMFDLADGTRFGRVELRQPIGGGVATVRGTNSGHAFLVVPADVRRVFVFDVGRPGDAGRRLPPLVVRVFATNHPRDSLRGVPLVLDPDDQTVPRRVILTQADGPNEMKLRSFALPPLAELAEPSPGADADPPQLAEAKVGGWSWFPPVADGERVAVCTDTGLFAAFGLNQPGQADKPIYQVPGQQPEGDPMYEDSFWVVSNGKLTRLRVAADTRGGQRILPAPDPRTVGEPLAAPQVRPADNVAVVTTKATEKGTVHLTAFDLTSGEERWRRQLGTVAVVPPIPQEDGSRLIVDECGGVYRATADSTDLTVLEKCEPKPAAVTPAVAAALPDGSRVWVGVHEPTAEGVKLTVRVVRKDGRPELDERAVSIPAGLAGNAVAVGEHLFFPLANGFVYRLGLKDAEATQGMAWRGANANAEAVCHLTATADGQLLYGDGDTQLFRQKWAADKGVPEKTGGPWELGGALSGPPLVVSAGGKEYVVAADASGVAVFDPTKPSTDPVRRWQGVEGGDLPMGKAGPLAAVGGKAAWAVGKAVAMANPGSDKPDWLVPLPADAGEVVGISALADGLLVACTGGMVFEVSVAGEVRGEATATPGVSVVNTSAVPSGEGNVLVPHADGSFSRLPVKRR